MFNLLMFFSMRIPIFKLLFSQPFRILQNLLFSSPTLEASRPSFSTASFATLATFTAFESFQPAAKVTQEALHFAEKFVVCQAGSSFVEQVDAARFQAFQLAAETAGFAAAGPAKVVVVGVVADFS